MASRSPRRGTSEKAAPLYADVKHQNHHGGAVAIGEHVYGAFDNGVMCVDIKTGKTLWQDRGSGKGSIFAADGMLYCRGEGGTITLAEVSPDGYKEKGSFSQPDRKQAPGLAEPRRLRRQDVHPRRRCPALLQRLRQVMVAALFAVVPGPPGDRPYEGLARHRQGRPREEGGRAGRRPREGRMGTGPSGGCALRPSELAEGGVEDGQVRGRGGRKSCRRRKSCNLHCRSGGRVLPAAGILKKAGYDVRPLKAGFDDLKDAGFPVAPR